MIVRLMLCALLLGGCDLLEDTVDDLNGGKKSDTTSDATSSTDTTVTPTPLNATATLTAQIRSVVANGQLYVEGNFTWSATGAPNLRVDVQIKNSVAYPDWTTLLADQDPVDVGTAGINGPDTRFNFRAVAYQASDPSNQVISNIVTIE